ncbi:LytR/AlgR family response regulator transcription factor [Jiulongibacter sp. NS-SX5]|uniref:LytR/AlgR family response regulator transcription factor n=1 Tax=Jiulongibacter sp. NS-SX5 TaxID=3463854 RepID=UPI004058ADFB
MKTSTSTARTFTFDYGKRRVAYEHIHYLKSEFGNYTKIHLAEDKQFLTAFTLKHYREQLEETDTFVVPRKGLMVNKHFVRGIDSTSEGVYVILKNGEKFKVSRRRTSEMMRVFA